MPRWGMVIDLDRCTGCQACTIACRMENNVPFCGDKNAWKGRAIFWNKVIAVRLEDGEQHQGSGENGHEGHRAAATADNAWSTLRALANSMALVFISRREARCRTRAWRSVESHRPLPAGRTQVLEG